MRFLPLTVLTALSTFFSVPDDHAQLITTPLGCLNPPTRTLEDVIGCLDAFTIPEGTYPCSGSGPRQPNTLELDAWNTMVGSLLNVDGNCASLTLPAAIAPFYTVNPYTEPGRTGRSFCIVRETTTAGTPPRYARGWGLVVVPARQADVFRCVHFSAPHPISDSGTPQQAAALFKRTRAKSLLITGRHRKASLCPSCQGSSYYKTDAAHDIVRKIVQLNLNVGNLISFSGRAIPPRDESHSPMAERPRWLPKSILRLHTDARRGVESVPRFMH